MKNYLDEIYTVPEFKRDNPALAEQAERALNYLKGYCPNNVDAIFVVIEVESYHCIAYLSDEFSPYTLGTYCSTTYVKLFETLTPGPVPEDGNNR